MRLPNGYGSVYKMSGARRNPWAVRITTGWEIDPKTQKTKQQYKFVGYYPTRKEALAALASYNKTPYDLDIARATLESVYEKWMSEYTVTASKNSIQSTEFCWKICKESGLDRMRISEVKLDHLQDMMDQCGKNAPTLQRLKIMLNQLFTFAVIHDYIPETANRVKYLKINAGNPDKIERKAFTSEEIDTLWGETQNIYVTIMLMLIYTGVRISELLDLKKSDVEMDKHIFHVVESKTQAGIRTVPIADKVYPFFVDWMQRSPCEYLLCNEIGKKMKYTNYRKSYFVPTLETYHLQEHRPHDTRHTCISMLAAAGVDERIIKKIVGHKGHGVTETVYTHFDASELLEAINKI